MLNSQVSPGVKTCNKDNYNNFQKKKFVSVLSLQRQIKCMLCVSSKAKAFDGSEQAAECIGTQDVII